MTPTKVYAMKTIAIAFACLVAVPGLADDTPAKTLASSIDVYVFPKDGQDASQQSKDEAGCYDWAVDNTGDDPFDLAKKAENDEEQSAAEMQAAETVGEGAGGRGAVRGAAAGAIIGEIASDDAGEGAAIGAAAGIIHGRREARAARHHASEEAAEQAEARQEATAEDLDNFKKAFSVCLEAKDYLVKY